MSIEAMALNRFLSDPDLAELIERVKTSDDMLDVIDLGENQHSDMLAWCLNPNEGHGQGDAVIKDLLLAACAESDSATYQNKKFFGQWTPGRIRTTSFGSAFITRESAIPVEGKKRPGRLDLFLVDPQNKIVVAIENKAGSKLTGTQLDRYQTAIKASIGQRTFFNDYEFAFIVLDRQLADYSDDHIDDLGTRWVLLDYSWLKASADRARMQVARHNLAAQLLVSYCQKQTDWESVGERKISEIAAKISLEHRAVVSEMQALGMAPALGWTPASMRGVAGELVLFLSQHRHLCALLTRSRGIAAVIGVIQSQLPGLRPDHVVNGRAWLRFRPSEVDAIEDGADELEWPIAVNIFKDSGKGWADPTYTLRLIWHHSLFDEIRCDPDNLLVHFKTKFPKLTLRGVNRVCYLVIGRKLTASEAGQNAAQLSRVIGQLLVDRPR